MKILSWNVNGLRAVQKKGFADWLKRARPDILCVQESRALPEQVEPDWPKPTRRTGILPRKKATPA